MRRVLETTAAEFGARLPFRLFLATTLMMVPSVWGWSQQASRAVEKNQAAEKQARTIEYKNAHYGFSLTLPASWQGYQVLWSEWQGSVLKENGGIERQLRGPKLTIRHPKWTEQNPHEDMPIMIFTIAQWKEEPVVSAAPFGPAELGRNRAYVFAVPPRWNYDFAEGWEEAQKILSSESLHLFNPAR